MNKLHLDHVSLDVQDLPGAQALLETRLGFRLTITEQAPVEHGRIFLDRGYVEVSAPRGAQEGRGQSKLIDSWRGYYLGTADARSYVAGAKGQGFNLSEPTVYQGHDGQWLDVEIREPKLQDQLPPIVQRETPAEVAKDWPPPLLHRHPNSAETLASIYVLAANERQAEAMFSVLSELVGTGTGAGNWRRDRFLQARTKSMALPGGRRIVVCHADGSGRAGTWLQQRGPGVLAAGLGTPSMVDARAYLSQHGFTVAMAASGSKRDQVWVEPAGDVGAYLLFEHNR